MANQTEHPDDNVHYLPARDPKPAPIAPIPSQAQRQQELRQVLLDIARASIPNF